ncbi:SPOR domain-containing protein [Billgrantia saliphila]|uniref:SPOR domain-containing protein n=1 Tax=Billgrantia saliphila TaxID=1848458 RepID=UPI0018CC53A2|nr:SPOR domain-containing protein [Halomonas saliphila]
MKYGMRERISGAVILIALAVIFVPMLFDEPAPRDERPQPKLTIEQPVPVERRDVPDPQPPESLGQIRPPEPQAPRIEPPPPLEEDQATEPDPRVEVPPVVATPSPDGETETSSPNADEAPREDPIAELAQAASSRNESDRRSSESSGSPASASPDGEWAVQVGSFGEAGNAERLQARLQEQGFSVYSRRRDNDMTTVYVGPYASSEAGERAMSEVKEQANLQGLLVRVRE